MRTVAPVALFVFNRPEHTQATLEALSNNHLAPYTHLYVFSDGPRNNDDSVLVEEVRRIVAKVRGFASVTVKCRDGNFGLANSIIAGVTEVIERQGRIIVLEDDLVTTANFLTYMNDALDFYENDSHAFSVTGYRISESFLRLPSSYQYDTFAGVRCSSWSWGTWQDRWSKVDWDMKYFESFMRDKKAQSAFERGGDDLTRMLIAQKEGRIDSWAIRYAYAHYAHRSFCIYPRKTLVQNIGLDNSGIHCQPDPRFMHTTIDQRWQPDPARFCPASQMDNEITKRFKSGFNGPAKIKTNLSGRIFISLKKFCFLVRSKAARFLNLSRNSDILFINTFEDRGGAAKAAKRLFDNVSSQGISASYLTIFRESSSKFVDGFRKGDLRFKLARRSMKRQARQLKNYPRGAENILTPTIKPNRYRPSLAKYGPRLVHLHWLSGGVVDFQELLFLKVPVVWTLHDTWAFTGGCHYTGACKSYEALCGACPQLGSLSDADITRQLMKAKMLAYARIDFTIVTPSRWLADVAASSTLFAGRRIEVIPNGLDTATFSPIDKEVARLRLGLPDKRPIILFGAQRVFDKRKGLDLLIEAISKIKIDCTLVSFGEGEMNLDLGSHVKVVSLGTVTQEEQLALAYSAADVFVCASREDNLPNTVAEALSCGTPCVAFAINGLVDMIDHKINGWLASPYNTEDMAKGIHWVLENSESKHLRQLAREKAIREYDNSVVTAKYLQVYDELLIGSKHA